ncbi:MAG: DUF4234 domain-containing protein [Bacteroidota bacterium]
MTQIPYFRRDPILVLILGFITCGIYLIYWNYKVTEVLNSALEREVMSPMLAAFSGCCMPLNLYFYYVGGNALTEVSQKTGNPQFQDKTVLLMVLGFFVPMVAAMVMQGHLNEMYDRTGAKG